MAFLTNLLSLLRCCHAAKTASQAFIESSEETQTDNNSQSQNDERTDRVAACLTIPPEPLGPPELAEQRMRNSPKFQAIGDVKHRYTIGKVLGAGGFAIVRLAKDKTTGQRFACKIIMLPKNERLSRHQVPRQEVFQEIEIASRANHPNIASVKEFYISDRKVSLIMDYLEGGMVLDSLLDRKDCRYTEDDARKVFKQVLEGLLYLHQRNVAHRDVKLENLLLSRKNDLSQIKLVDFGLSKHTTEKMNSVLGTPQFVSPEMLRRTSRQYDCSVDLWSAGVLLYIFLCGFPPFHDKNEQVLFKKILSGSYSFAHPVWRSVSDEAKDLIKGLLTKDVKRRLTAAQALSHPWFSSDTEYTQPLEETRRNLLRLRGVDIREKARRVVAIDTLNLDQTKDSLEDVAETLEMEDMEMPAFLQEEAREYSSSH